MRNIDKLIGLTFSVNRKMRGKCHGENGSFVGQAVLLFVLERGTPSMREISGFLGVTPGSATSVVNGLVEAGKLIRQQDDNDRRVVRLMLTETGKAEVTQHIAIMTEHLKELFAPLDDNDIGELVRLFTKIEERCNVVAHTV